jgi:hypothetical protein
MNSKILNKDKLKIFYGFIIFIKFLKTIIKKNFYLNY